MGTVFGIVGYFVVMYALCRLAGWWFITKKKTPELPWHS